MYLMTFVPKLNHLVLLYGSCLTPIQRLALPTFWNGEIGIFDQVRYIESPRCESISGSGTSKVYATVLLGKQALLEAVSYEPKTVIGPVTDKLMRFRPAGWKGLLGMERLP